MIDHTGKMSHQDGLCDKESRCKGDTLGKTSGKEDISINNQDNNKNKNVEKNNDSVKECWYFRKGCKNGNRCRYIHREVCKQWKENGCCYNNRCKYEHPVQCKWLLQGECRQNNCWYLHPTRIQQNLRKNNGGPRQSHNYNQYQRTNQTQERSHWGQNQDQNFGHRQNRRGWTPPPVAQMGVTHPMGMPAEIMTRVMQMGWQSLMNQGNGMWE